MILCRRFADILAILIINPAREINIVVNIAVGHIRKHLRRFVDEDHRNISGNLIEVLDLIQRNLCGVEFWRLHAFKGRVTAELARQHFGRPGNLVEACGEIDRAIKLIAQNAEQCSILINDLIYTWLIKLGA